MAGQDKPPYTGPERRRKELRSGKDRRAMVRYEPDSQDRRTNRDRRTPMHHSRSDSLLEHLDHHQLPAQSDSAPIRPRGESARIETEGYNGPERRQIIRRQKRHRRESYRFPDATDRRDGYERREDLRDPWKDRNKV